MHFVSYVESSSQHSIYASNQRIFIAPAFLSVPLHVYRQRSIFRSNTPVVRCQLSSRSQPRIVVLPGMDGTGLLLENFRGATSTPDDPNRVIPVEYPVHKPLPVRELGRFVCENYLESLANDSRGYILVNQSFSGHVGLHLAQNKTPGVLRGQVFVNAFASTPAPSGFRFIPSSVTNYFFRTQPPPWLVGRLFLGRNPVKMADVQSAASRVQPCVMSHRLSLCLTENNWHIWRRSDLLPSARTLYLRGDDDVILGKRQASQIQLSRPDIEWFHIPGGPHLLLQAHGIECGIVVNDFCARLPEGSAGCI